MSDGPDVSKATGTASPDGGSERRASAERATGGASTPRRLSGRHWLYLVGGLISVAVFIAALAISCSYNPTPTNPSGGGPGSGYPHLHGPVGYTKPIGGNGPQSS